MSWQLLRKPIYGYPGAGGWYRPKIIEVSLFQNSIFSIRYFKLLGLCRALQLVCDLLIKCLFIYFFIYLFHKFDIWYLLTRLKLKRYLNKWNTRNKVTLQGAKQPWYIILISEWKVVNLFKKYLFSPHFLEIRSIF